jgi:Domain of unknown function (DUF1707)
MESYRASDDDRERAAQQLRDHFAAGRLTQDELDERVQAVFRAHTDRELRELLSDLPRLPVSPRQRKAELAERRSHLQRRLVQETGGGLGLFMICTVIWLAAGASGMFWPIWVAILPAITLLRNGWRLYGPAPELDRVERELEAKERLRERHRRHAYDRAGRRRQR